MTAALWTHTESTRRTHRLNAAWQLAQEQAAVSAQGHDCLTCPLAEDCSAQHWSECAFVDAPPPEMTPATLEEAGTYSPREELWQS
jgi:hypothetical protein